MLPRAPVQPQGAIIPAKAAVLYEMVVDSSRREALQFCRAHCLSWNSGREREYMCVCVCVCVSYVPEIQADLHAITSFNRVG